MMGYNRADKAAAAGLLHRRNNRSSR